MWHTLEVEVLKNIKKSLSSIYIIYFKSINNSILILYYYIYSLNIYYYIIIKQKK
jgi:hypothetical protein